jgi:cyanophycinase
VSLLSQINNTMQLDSQSELTRSSSTKRTIMVIGGAEDKVHGREILRTFFMKSGGSEAKIGIVPSASREPALQGERYVQIFQEMGAAQIWVFDIRERFQGDDPIWSNYLEECTGIFITGGDQLRLCSLLADTPLMDKIRDKARSGQIVLAGTSAGAAVMGYHMIAGGGSGASPNRSLVDMTVGLDFIPNVIVDQHFHNRNRMARLLSAISTHPDKLGIGVDEDTCAMFDGDGLIQVLGKGTVTVVDTQEMSHTNAQDIDTTEPLSLFNLRLHILAHGDCFDLHSRTAKPGNTQKNTALED